MAILKFQNEAQVSLFLVCKLICLNKLFIPCKAAWKRIENSDLVGLINLIRQFIGSLSIQTIKPHQKISGIWYILNVIDWKINGENIWVPPLMGMISQKVWETIQYSISLDT